MTEQDLLRRIEEQAGEIEMLKAQNGLHVTTISILSGRLKALEVYQSTASGAVNCGSNYGRSSAKGLQDD